MTTMVVSLYLPSLVLCMGETDSDWRSNEEVVSRRDGGSEGGRGKESEGRKGER